MRIYWCESTEHSVDTFLVARNRSHAAELAADLARFEDEKVVVVSHVRHVPKVLEQFDWWAGAGEAPPELLHACGGRLVGFLGEAPLLRRLEATWKKAMAQGTQQERGRAALLLYRLHEQRDEPWRQVWSFDGRVLVQADDFLCLVQLFEGGTN